jgi:hypothetical protein
MTILWTVICGIPISILLWTFAETLLWWYLWNKSSQPNETAPIAWQNAVVLLTGISNYASADLATEQRDLLQELGKIIEVDVIIDEPFPYNKSIAQKFANWQIWHYLSDRELPLWLISLYNFWQAVLVTIVEKSYGNAIARCIVKRLGTPTSPNGHLWLICGSIGAGLAVAAAPKLQADYLQAKIVIIAYGGVFRASAGLDRVERFYHLTGTQDNWAKLGARIFPSRRSSGDAFICVSTGNHKHLEYLSDSRSAIDNKTYRELTLDTITQLPIWRELTDKPPIRS